MQDAIWGDEKLRKEYQDLYGDFRRRFVQGRGEWMTEGLASRQRNEKENGNTLAQLSAFSATDPRGEEVYDWALKSGIYGEDGTMTLAIIGASVRGGMAVQRLGAITTNPAEAQLYSQIEEAKGYAQDVSRGTMTYGRLSGLVPEELLDQGTGHYMLALRTAIHSLAEKNGVQDDVILKMPANGAEAQALFKDADKVAYESLAAQYGKQTADALWVSSQAKLVGTPELIKIFSAIKEAPEGGRVKGTEHAPSDASIDDIMKLLEGIQAGTIATEQDAQGHVSVPGLVFDLLMRPDQAIGAVVEGLAVDTGLQYLVTEQGVWDDPYAYTDWVIWQLKNDPNAVWEESGAIRSGQAQQWQESQSAAFRGEHGRLNVIGAIASAPVLMVTQAPGKRKTAELVRTQIGKNPIKATLVTGVKAQPEGLLHGLMNGWRAFWSGEGPTTAQVLIKSSLYGTDPQDWITRSPFVTLSWASELAASPLNWWNGGALSVTNTRALLLDVSERAAKVGAEFSPNVLSRGVRSFKEIGEGAARPIPGALARQTFDVKLGNMRLSGAGAQVWHTIHSATGSKPIADLITRGIITNPRFLPDAIPQLLKSGPFRDRLLRMMRSSGLFIHNAGEAAETLLEMVGPLQKVLKPETANGWYNKWRGMLYGQRAAAYEKARGIYFAGTSIGTQMATDPVRAAFSRLAEAGERVFEGGLPQYALTQTGKLFSQWLNTANALVRARTHFMVNLPAEQTLPGAAQRILAPTKEVIPMGPDIAEAVARWQQSGVGIETQVRKMQTAYLLDNTGKALPHETQVDLSLMLERSPASGSPEQVWAGAMRGLTVARKQLAAEKELAALSLDEMEVRLAQIEQFVTPAEIAATAQRMEPYKRNFFSRQDLGVRVQETLGRQYELFDPRENYVTHYFRNIPANATQMIRQQGWDAYIQQSKGTPISTRGSEFNLRRTGPPDLVRAKILGFDPVMDIGTLSELRWLSIHNDARNAELMTAFADTMGVVPISSKDSAMRILSGELSDHIRYEKSWETRAAVGETYTTELGELQKVYNAASSTARKGQKFIDDATAAGKPLSFEDHELAQTYFYQLAAAREAAGNLADKVGRSREEILTLLQNGNRTDRLRMQAQSLLNHMKGRNTNLFGFLRATERRETVLQQLTYYDDANKLMDRIGISARDRAPVLMELYGVPSLDYLSPEQARAFTTGHADLQSFILKDLRERPYRELKEVPGGRGYETMKDAIAAFTEDREYGKVFAKFTRDEINGLGERLANTYLPVEAVLVLNSLGGGFSGVHKAVTGGLLEGLMQLGRTALVERVNAFYKPMVTVFRPDLTFGRRAQIDAAMKVFQHSGLAALSPGLRKEWKDWVAGRTSWIQQGTGGRVHSAHAHDVLGRYGVPSYERALGLRQALSEATTAEQLAGVGEMVGEATEAAGRAMEGKGMFSMATTGGRLTTAREVAVPWGPQSVEALDNTTRSWIYFMEIKSGKSPEHALQETLKVARDYTNQAPFEKWFIARGPILFENFLKQNTISFLKVLGQHPNRVAVWPKFIEFMEGNIPEELRPEWADRMSAIGMGREFAFMPNDMSSLGWLDGTATIGDHILKGKPLAPAFRFAVSEMTRMASPVGAAATGAEMAGGRINLGPALSKFTYNLFGPGAMPLGLGQITEKGGRPDIEFSGPAKVLLAATGLGIWANSLARMSRRAALGEWGQQFVEWSGLARYYDYSVGDAVDPGLPQEVVKQLDEAFWLLRLNSDGRLAFNSNAGEKVGIWAEQVMRATPRFQDILRAAMDYIRTVQDISPGRTAPPPSEVK